MKEETENTALQIRELLKSSGPGQAEHQLMVIGTNVGDHELARVIGELGAPEVVALVGEGDYTKPSIVASFITPEQFIGALDRLGAKWGEIGPKDGLDVLVSLKQDLADFILSVVLTAESGNRPSLFKALTDYPLGRDSLVAIATGDTDSAEFLKGFDAAMAQKGTWQELYVELQQFDERVFKAIRTRAAGLYSGNAEISDLEAADDDSEDRSPSTRFLRRTLSTLSRKAQRLAEAETPAGTKTDEVFVNV